MLDDFFNTELQNDIYFDAAINCIQANPHLVLQACSYGYRFLCGRVITTHQDNLSPKIMEDPKKQFYKELERSYTLGMDMF